jgi:putative transposase
MQSPVRKSYPSDLSDARWAILEPLIPPAKGGGRPREVDMREIVNAMLFLNRSGCQWDMLPHDLPPKSSVYVYFAQWREDGTWQRLVDALRTEVRTEVEKNREPTPSAACIDSQTVKSAGQPATDTGYDGAKKITGRKRHLLVDTLGLLLAVVVTSAAIDDAAAAPDVLRQLTAEQFPRLKVVWADSKYHNHKLLKWIGDTGRAWTLEVKRRPKDAKGFVLLPRRWVVERTHAWIGRCRRHSRDYERYTTSSESMIQMTSIGMMLRRLAPNQDQTIFKYRVAA